MRLSRTAVFWIVAAAFVGFLAWTSLRSQSVSCEVCMSFAGGERCSRATGPNAADATQTAQTAACGPLASGMDQSIACSRTPPRSVSCSGG